MIDANDVIALRSNETYFLSSAYKSKTGMTCIGPLADNVSHSGRGHGFVEANSRIDTTVDDQQWCVLFEIAYLRQFNINSKGRFVSILLDIIIDIRCLINVRGGIVPCHAMMDCLYPH